jgi:hypothetical protein
MIINTKNAAHGFLPEKVQGFEGSRFLKVSSKNLVTIHFSTVNRFKVLDLTP